MLFFINFFITGCDLADNQKSSIYKKYYRLVYKTIYYYIQNDEITKELTNVFLASINSCIPEKNFSSTLVTKYVI